MNDSESGLKPRLLDALDYETDIAPHRFISIWAGVGSGKNFLIEKMITGDPKENTPKLSVLLITSRKSKVLESLRRLGDDVCTTTSDFRNYEDLLYESPFDPDIFKRIIYDEEGIFELSLYQRSVICTDAFIEAYLKHCHQPDSPRNAPLESIRCDCVGRSTFAVYRLLISHSSLPCDEPDQENTQSDQASRS